EINRQGTVVLLVEQNANLALRMADRAYVLEAGRIVVEGTGAERLAKDAGRRGHLGESCAPAAPPPPHTTAAPPGPAGTPPPPRRGSARAPRRADRSDREVASGGAEAAWPRHYSFHCSISLKFPLSTV